MCYFICEYYAVYNNRQTCTTPVGLEASWRFWLWILLYDIFLKIWDGQGVKTIPKIKVFLSIIFIGYFWQGWLIENDFQWLVSKSDTFVFCCCEPFSSHRLKITPNLFSKMFLVRRLWQTVSIVQALSELRSSQTMIVASALWLT